MQGIKAHSQEDRTKIVEKVVEILKDKFGSNLEAIAAEGSYARGNDKDFSDLELTVFLKTIPEDAHYDIHKIVDGQLIVVIIDTRESFVRKYLSNDFSVWYASGSEDMLPIYNHPFVDEINKIRPDNIEKKCMEQIQLRWPVYQEITAKLLNNINDKNKEAIPLIFPEMFKLTLILLSYLNHTPYTTLARYISQAKKFAIQPQGFEELVNITIEGNYIDNEKTNKIVLQVFSNFELILKDKGLNLYCDSLTELW